MSLYRGGPASDYPANMSKARIELRHGTVNEFAPRPAGRARSCAPTRSGATLARPELRGGDTVPRRADGGKAPRSRPPPISRPSTSKPSPRNVARMVEEGGKALAAYMKPREEGKIQDERAEEVTDVVKTLGHVLEYWLADPQRAFDLQTRLGKSYLDLWASAVKRMAGEEAAPVAAPDPRDKRFTDPEWSSNQFFDFLKQAYLLTVEWANHLVTDAAGPRSAHAAQGRVLRPPDRQRDRRRRISCSPIRNCCARRWRRMPRISCAACTMLAEDIEAGGGDLKIRQSDASKFEVGRNLALTPGKVIFQNELMQLIQYAPTTEKRAEAAAADRAALDQQVLHSRSDAGQVLHQMVRRPGPHGVLHFLGQSGRAARAEGLRRLHARRPARGDRRRSSRSPARSKIHALGYCVGGTLLSITLAYMAAKGDNRVTVGDAADDPGRLHPCRRPQGVRRRRGADRDGRAPDGRARLSRRQEDGDRVQPAALERPDLALRHQQLSQGPGAVRRSTCCTGTPTRRACRPPIIRSICATAISKTG